MEIAKYPMLLGLIWLALWAIWGCEEKTSVELPYVAKVGAERITRADVDQAMKGVLAGGFEIKPDSEDYQKIEQHLLDELIEKKLLLMEARRRSVVVTEEEINERLKGSLNLIEAEKLEKELAPTGLTKETLKKEINDRLKVEKLLQVEEYSRILIKDHAILAAYESNMEKYIRPERVHARQIVVATEKEAKQVMRRIYRREKFEELAKELTLTPEKDRGGDLGWVSRGTMPEPFDTLLFKLPKRIVNKPVKTNYGYHIIQILSHDKEKQLPFEDVRGIIRMELFSQKKIEAKARLLERLKNQVAVLYGSEAGSKEREVK